MSIAKAIRIERMRIDFFKLYTSKKFCTLKSGTNKFWELCISKSKHGHFAYTIINTVARCTLLTDLLVDCLRRKRHIRRKATQSESQNLIVHCGLHTIFTSKWTQYQMENHYMVILTIPKIESDVNDFQNSINILLIINNLFSRFLVNLTHWFFLES